jgi:hypothetical protein
MQAWHRACKRGTKREERDSEREECDSERASVAQSVSLHGENASYMAV